MYTLSIDKKASTKRGSKSRLKKTRRKSMPKKPKYPYPVPEFIAYLEATQEIRQNEEHDFIVLAKLLQFCHATLENAHAIWNSGRYAQEEPEIPTYDAIQFGFRRLIPLMINSTVGGWHELLTYVEQPEKYPWYDPLVDWSCTPPLKEFRPDKDYEEEDPSHTEQEEPAQTVMLEYIPF